MILQNVLIKNPNWCISSHYFLWNLSCLRWTCEYMGIILLSACWTMVRVCTALVMEQEEAWGRGDLYNSTTLPEWLDTVASMLWSTSSTARVLELLGCSECCPGQLPRGRGSSFEFSDLNECRPVEFPPRCESSLELFNFDMFNFIH